MYLACRKSGIQSLIMPSERFSSGSFASSHGDVLAGPGYSPAGLDGPVSWLDLQRVPMFAKGSSFLP